MTAAGFTQENAAAAWAGLAQGPGPSISVWLVRLGRRPAHDLARTLCPAERAQLAAFAAAEPARDYAGAHAALRHLVGRVLVRRPEAVRFAHPGDRLQPPLLRDADGLFPSLSHSGGFAAIALRRGGPVGVDIEPLERASETASVTRHYLSETELAAVAPLPRAERARRSLALWCAKEAVLKAAGTGFSTDPRRVVLDARADAGVPAQVYLEHRYIVRGLAAHRLAGLEGAVAAQDADPAGTLSLTDLDWLLDQR